MSFLPFLKLFFKVLANDQEASAMITTFLFDPLHEVREYFTGLVIHNLVLLASSGTGSYLLSSVFENTQELMRQSHFKVVSSKLM